MISYRRLADIGRIAATMLVFFSIGEKALALECSDMRQLTSFYLRSHISGETFDDEISKRTLDMFIKYWDPAKLYFLQSDVEQFTKDYNDKIDNMVAANDCSMLNKMMDVYSKRYNERLAQIKKVIDAKHDFTVEEYLNIEPKNETYPKTMEEVNERWRKRVKFQMLQLRPSLKNDMKVVREKMLKRYQLQAKRQNELTMDDIYSSFLNAFSLALDPHSQYLSPDVLEDFRISTRLSLEGIGAVLGSEDGFTKIQSLVPGGAAYKTGKLKEQDKIIAVAQGANPPVDVIDMDLREVVKLVRGPRGTEVRLTILRDDKEGQKRFEVPMIREKVELKDRGAKSFVYNVEQLNKQGKKDTIKVGVIDLPSFYIDFEGRQAKKQGYKSSSEDVKAELEKLKKQKIDLVVVDLRSNGGGALDEAVKLTGLFIDSGPVVQVKNVDGSQALVDDDGNQILYDGPMVVMINRHSASASEIFAGAIADYQRGLIVGDSHTFGKGTVQNLADLDPRLGAVKVTISKFYRPSGSSTQLNGVDADIKFPSLLDVMEVGEKYYDYALPWDKIKESPFKKWNMVKPYASNLAAVSVARVAKDPAFDELRKSIKEFDEKKENRDRVSLKEDDKKDKKDKAKDGDDEDEKVKETDDPKLRLKDDIYLQETLRIAADYVSSIKKQPLAEKLVLSELPLVTVANDTSKGKADKKQVTGTDHKKSTAKDN